jgi:hypothetical protein
MDFKTLLKQSIIEEANKGLQSSLSSETYPIATRYIDSYGTYYIERPPFQANVDYKMGGAHSRTKRKLTNTMVWIPWTIFVFNPKTQKSAMYFSHKSLTNMDDVYFVSCEPFVIIKFGLFGFPTKDNSFSVIFC